jgi:hypothetical protein
MKVGQTIASRTSRIETQTAGFQIRAQSLRGWKGVALASALSGFGVVPGEAMMQSSGDETPRKGWRQADVKRAIGAAEQAGLTNYRVEIAPDGTITIVVGEPAAEARA